MNKIPLPAHNDVQAIHDLSVNTRLGSHPHLIPAVPLLQAGYIQYESVRGNAFLVTPIPLGANQKAHLRNHYASPPPSELGYINEIREASDPLVCPMCGSANCGTLDHILPQADYPEFAVFSKNLVPACKCNSKRQNTLLGGLGERILHPYFDACLGERLISARVLDFGPAPTILLRLEIAQTHPEYAAIAFHVEKIVKRTAICGYLRKQWDSMCLKPSRVIRALGTINPSTEEDLRLILEDELHLLDEHHGGKNNWNSVFIAGLLHGGTLASLFQQLTQPGRGVNAPLF